MSQPSLLLLGLDLLGTSAFALNGALTALRAARLDLVGVLTLGAITALGGGIVRDVLLGAVPPATLQDWRYLVVATVGGLLAFAAGHRLARLATPILVLDALGLSLFAVTGAGKALELGLGPGQAVLLGGITAVGGGTLRDVLVAQVPTVLRSGLYAVPALLGAAVAVGAEVAGAGGAASAVLAAGTCLAVRLLGVRYGVDLPGPRGLPGD
ncbi:trimeric intracellular cation channel family protein [Vallicoccus soli]|uniref:Trimeric intracellular cation channel family protein n=1 Tax=Vallicoccus soli TaxID=2339232 RepID=A0A3A3YWM2_9ACTN|nr:trimeric intracellular cation channel family protein [Vallicoccus soli]RJK95957.1 trimeric intracellular cation channel family protein [Vallicoccus soli]